MAERKRPRRTRERILETGLELFNRDGAPRVTTADIADEMGISPGNLTHRAADRLSMRYNRAHPLFSRPPAVDDLWLRLHLLLNGCGKRRFLYRDLDQLTTHDDKLGARFGASSGTRRPQTVCGAGRRGSDAHRPGNRALAQTRCRRRLLAVVRSVRHGSPTRHEGGAGPRGVSSWRSSDPISSATRAPTSTAWRRTISDGD